MTTTSLPTASRPASQIRLDGKVILVTGASAGIGQGLARLLAGRGAHVVGTGRRLEPGRAMERELREQGLSFSFHCGDVSRREDCESAVAATLAAHGRLDVLINNAGMSLPNKRIEDIEDDDWQRIVSVTLEGVVKMTRAALPTLQAQRSGAIINVASLTAMHGIERMGAYAAAKGGVISFTRVLAIENLAYNIQANTVLMGAVATPQSQESLLDIGRSLHGPDWVPSAELLASAGSMLMTPDDVAPAMALLCSDDAREINGSIIAVDRCWSAGLMTSTMLYRGAAGTA